MKPKYYLGTASQCASPKRNKKSIMKAQWWLTNWRHMILSFLGYSPRLYGEGSKVQMVLLCLLFAILWLAESYGEETQWIAAYTVSTLCCLSSLCSIFSSLCRFDSSWSFIRRNTVKYCYTWPWSQYVNCIAKKCLISKEPTLKNGG